MQLADFHGIAWTGSPLGAYETSPAVTGQIALAREVFQRLEQSQTDTIGIAS